jgi:hypothetical protein
MWAWLLVIDDAQLDESVEVDSGAVAYRWPLAGLDDGVKIAQVGLLPMAAVIEALTAGGWHLMD